MRINYSEQSLNEEKSMKVRRVRCPNCKSLNTNKNGKRKINDYSLECKSTKTIQRYKCKD